MTAPKLIVLPSLPDGPEEKAVQFLAGDDAAFGAVARATQVALYRVVKRYAPLPADALDLVQRVFLQALEAKRRPPPSEGAPSLRAWLFRIALNLAKNHARDASRWKRAPVEALEAAAAHGTPEEALHEHEAKALARAAVAELPPRQRDVFTLRVDGALPFAEVAKALDITEGNAKSNFHLAVKRLREQVALAQTPGASP